LKIGWAVSVSLLVLCFAIASRASSQSGAQLQNIGPDARAEGMGRAFTAVAEGPATVWWNPGALGLAQPVVGELSFGKLVPDLANDIWFASVGGAGRLGLLGLGGHFGYLNHGKSIVTDEIGNIIGRFRSWEYDARAGAGIDLAKAFAPQSDLFHWGIGGSFKLFHVHDAPAQFILDGSSGIATSWDLDVGTVTALRVPVVLASSDTPEHPSYLTVSAAGVIRNALVHHIRFGGDAYPLGRYDRVGLAMEAKLFHSPDFGHLFRGLLTADANGVFLRPDHNETPILNYGIEGTLLGILSGRSGYIFDRDGDIRGWTWGAGIGIEPGEQTSLGLPIGGRLDVANVPQARGLARVWKFGLSGWVAAPHPPLPPPPPPPTADSDRDGVPDSIDQEPNTPHGAQVDPFGRALDDDGDRVPNGIDREPGTRQGMMVDKWGRSIDADRDGVTDSKDKCPDTPVEYAVDEDGCPIIEDMLKRMGNYLARVPFETGQATLLPTSFELLDSIGVALSRLPNTLRLEVAGHCDDVGTDEYNLGLSRNRAEAVVDYLVRKYPTVLREQFTVRGYGKSRPLVPGVDEASREQNRRVEFVVLNPEVLRIPVRR